jgi:hypothetical protein
VWQRLRSLNNPDPNHERNDGEKVHCGPFLYNPAAPGRKSTQAGRFNHKASDQGNAAGKTLAPESSISVAHIQAYANCILPVPAQQWSFQLAQMPEAKSVATRP